jgi:ABC-type dipeptide/oligopeptide/nickel transport system ATPase component
VVPSLPPWLSALLMASAPGVQHERELSVRQLRRTAADPAPPSGPGACVFAARCPFATAICASQPELTADTGNASFGRIVACHHYDEWSVLASDRAPAHQ